MRFPRTREAAHIALSVRGRRARRGWSRAVAAVLLATVISGCGSSDNKQASSRKAKETTTAPTTTTSAPTTSVAPTTTATTQPPSTGPPSTDATTETTEPPPECHNSFDPQCGPFRWEPSPANQRILVESIVVDPPHPVIGQAVTVTIQWSDPDADLAYVLERCGDVDGCAHPLASCTPPLHPPTGPWNPPPPSPGRGTLVEHFHFPAAGTYGWTISIITRSSTVPLQLFCGHSDPYGSYIKIPGIDSVESLPITVLPELPPFPTIPQ